MARSRGQIGIDRDLSIHSKKKPAWVAAAVVMSPEFQVDLSSFIKMITDSCSWKFQFNLIDSTYCHLLRLP